MLHIPPTAAMRRKRDLKIWGHFPTPVVQANYLPHQAGVLRQENAMCNGSEGNRKGMAITATIIETAQLNKAET